MDSRQQSYGLPSAVHGLSHGLKIARQLSIFTPVCALVSAFQVLCMQRKTAIANAIAVFLCNNPNFEILRHSLYDYTFTNKYSIKLIQSNHIQCNQYPM